MDASPVSVASGKKSEIRLSGHHRVCRIRKRGGISISGTAGTDSYIKLQTYEKWKKRSFKQEDISKRENMAYDESEDSYTCHAGKRLTKQSVENIMSPREIFYRVNRSIQVDGVFGILKHNYEFQRFLLRGKPKVKQKILLLHIGYNIHKLHAKIQSDINNRLKRAIAFCTQKSGWRNQKESSCRIFMCIKQACCSMTKKQAFCNTPGLFI